MPSKHSSEKTSAAKKVLTRKRVAKKHKMRSNAVYNSADNMVMVKTNGDEINVICN